MEVSLVKSVECFLDDPQDVKPSIPWDLRQQDDPLQVRVAALVIAPSSSASSLEDRGPATGPRP